jgi:dihydrofolate synthase/folylpolyglutamate synthase
MTYSQAIEFLYNLRLFGAKFGLDNTRKLAALAGNPQEKLRFIHIAGTNGKGSTCAMLESIYRSSGLRVGLFTSPHLVSFAERIQVDRQLIAESDVARLVSEAREWLRTFPAESHPTFFEVVTVMAMKYFAEKKCDLVVFETGMGGRLDATNIVTPLASVITNVQLDHQQWLGNTLEQIAVEKAGIIKPGIPVITAAESPALEVIQQTALDRHAPLSAITPLTLARLPRYEVGLLGEHQHLNAAVALETLRVLQPRIPVSAEAVAGGLKKVQWAGRLQLVKAGGQNVLLDGAHNPAGALTLARAIPRVFSSKPAMILGAMRDKDWPAMCHTLAPLASSLFLCPTGSHERTADPRLLESACRAANPEAPIRVCESLSQALKAASAEPVLVLAGSLYIVGEAMELLRLSPTVSELGLNDWSAVPVARGK